MKKPKIKIGEQIVASSQVLADSEKLRKLTHRTHLSADELMQPMTAIETKNKQVKVSHPRLKEPFTVHTKFLEHAPAVR